MYVNSMLENGVSKIECPYSERIEVCFVPQDSDSHGRNLQSQVIYVIVSDVHVDRRSVRASRQVL